MVKETKKFAWERSAWSIHFAHFWSVPKGDIECLLASAGRYKSLTGFCHKLYEVTWGTTDLGSSLASCRACHSFTQAHCRVSKVQQKMCSLGEQRTRAPSILTLFWRIVDEPPRWKVVAEPQKTPGFLASGGEEFNLGPVTRLDRSELLCNKVLLKYKRDRENFWQRHQKGAERVPPR